MVSHQFIGCNILRLHPGIYAFGLAAGIAGTIAVPYIVAAHFGHDVRLGGHAIEWMGKTVVTLRSPLAIYDWAASADNWPAELIGGLLASSSSIALSVASTAGLAWHAAYGRGLEKFGKDAWGKRKDALKAGIIQGNGSARNASNSPFKVVLGEAFGSILTSTTDAFVGIFGGTRLGKSRLISLTGLEWEESAIFYLAGATNDIWKWTSGYRSTFSNVIFFDLSDPACWRFNPLSEVRIGSDYEWDDCLLIAKQLPPEDEESARVPYWVTTGTKLIAAIIQYVLNFYPADKRNMESVYKIANMDLSGLSKTLEECAIETVNDTARSYLKGRPEDARKIMEAAQNYISPWASPVIRKVTRHSDFRLSDLVAERTSLYLRLPDNMTKQWARILKVLIAQIRNMMMCHEDMTPDGREKLHELLFAIDEFGTFADDEWDSAASRLAKYGARILMAMQSPRTLDEKFGGNQTILENVSIQIYMSSSDPKTQKMVSDQVGKTTEIRTSRSIKADFLNPIPDSRTKSRSEQVRSIMESSEVRAMPKDEQILLVVGHPPFRVGKPIDFTDREPWKSRILPPASKAPPARPVTKITKEAELTGASI